MVTLPAISGPELLQHILRDANLCEAFSNFLVTKYSHENIRFWLSAEQWKENPTGNEAQEIFQTYIKENGEYQVNIEGWIRQTIETELQTRPEDPPNTLFQMAQDQIFHLMYFSLLPDFQVDCKTKANPAPSIHDSGPSIPCRLDDGMDENCELDDDDKKRQRRTWEHFIPCI
jgi:hypothetical protein